MSSDLYKDLGLKVKGQKYRFVDTDANMDDDGFLPIENSSAPQEETYSLANINNKNKDNKIDTLTENFQNNITNRSGAEEANIKRTIKKLNQQTPKYLKQTKTDITDKEERIAERQVTYENLTQDISTYQDKVNKMNDADVVNFALTKFKNNTTLNSIKQNNKLNSFEDAINKTLVKNKYETDDKILEEERNKLYASVNPEIIKQRYEELKKMRSLMYQQEIKNMHKNKIKSKLYHKIKKKQKQKQEDKLLEQLKEIDPEAVNEYLKKKMEQRVDERISLKHTLNKFNKTVKRYNLLYDPNVKESLMENYRKRDKLLEKVRNPNADEDDDDEIDNDDEEEENEEEEDEYIDVDDEEMEDEDDDNEKENVDSKIDKKQILIDFNEKKDKKKEKKDAGVLSMNFMKKSNELSEQVNSLIKNTSGKNDNEEVDYSNKTKIQFKLGGNKKKDNKEEKIDINQKILMNSKSERLGKLEEGNESKNTKDRKNSIDDRYNKLTSSMLNKITYEKNTKDSNNNYDLQLTENLVDEIVKENKNKDEENLLKSFLVENNENKEDFIKDTFNEILDNNKQDFVKGWGSWTGSSKMIKTKEFLKSKRMKETQQKKAIKEFSEIKNPTVKVTNLQDKKITNYMVNELPYNIQNKEQFEKLNSTNLGPEWNALSSYKQVTQNKVVKFIGKIINPMDHKNDLVRTQKINDILAKNSKKIIRTKTKL